ncbi:MAG: YchJ family protein [Phormidesmis sp.]
MNQTEDAPQKLSKKPPEQLCPCGNRRQYARCCEQYLTGKKLAPTAETLMRSRYTAFCLGRTDYLIATHHKEHRAADDPDTLEKSIQNTRWINLLVVGTQKGQKKDKKGTVEFVAAYRNATAATSPKIEQLHERSQFVRENGQWFYTEGDMLPPYRPKREQPCWCGSGQKFRQCHEKMA